MYSCLDLSLSVSSILSRQEPELDLTKNVRENVMLGVAPKKEILDRYNDLAMNYSDDTAEEMATLQDKIEAENLWDLVNQNQVGLVMLKIVEIIGEDNINDLDPETIYFLNKILNKLNLKKIRNNILSEALPVRV